MYLLFTKGWPVPIVGTHAMVVSCVQIYYKSTLAAKLRVKTKITKLKSTSCCSKHYHVAINYPIIKKSTYAQFGKFADLLVENNY